MRRLLTKTRRGITVTEIMATSGVFMLLVITMVMISIATSRQWATGSSRMMADNDASLAIQVLSRDIQDGIRATTNTDRTQLTVVFPITNGQGDFDRLTDGATIRYYRTNNKLYRQRGTNTPQQLAENITNLRFTVDGNRVVLELTARQKQGTKTADTALMTNVALRNTPPT